MSPTQLSSATARDRLRLERRPLGKTGLRVSPLALSAMSMGSKRRGPQLSPEDVERAFHELGVNTFLVSRLMPALCEGIKRLVRAGHRDELVIIGGAGMPTGWGVRGSFEKNARAAGLDYFDVYMVGWVQYHWYVTGKTWPAMQKLQQEGKARALAISAHDRKLACRLARELKLDVLMCRYNASHRGAERDIFEPLGEGRPGIISYTATRWGALLEPLPKQGFPEAMRAPECYRFVLGNPAVDTVLCAATSFDQVREDVEGVLAGPLDPERLAWVKQLGDAVHGAVRGGRYWAFR